MEDGVSEGKPQCLNKESISGLHSFLIFIKTKVHISDFTVSFCKESSYIYCFVSAIPYETFETEIR